MSTVVTTLILVAAAGVIGAFLVSWANSSFAVQQLNIANQTSSRINLVREDFVIEDVWFYTAGQEYANVTIRNTGDLALTVSRIYINNSEVPVVDEIIPMGEKEEIQVATAWDPGAPQTILVMTERGTSVKQVWKS